MLTIMGSTFSADTGASRLESAHMPSVPATSSTCHRTIATASKQTVTSRSAFFAWYRRIVDVDESTGASSIVGQDRGSNRRASRNAGDVHGVLQLLDLAQRTIPALPQRIVRREV